MSLDAALRHLGLSAEYERDDVEREFRRRVIEAHPDKGGRREAWDELVEARDVAGRALSRRVDLVLLDRLEMTLRQNEISLRRARLSGESESVRRAVLRRRTSRLTAAKRRSWAAATIVGGTAALLQVVKLAEPKSLGAVAASPFWSRVDPWTVELGIAAAAVAVIGFAYKVRSDRIEHAIEDLTVELSDADGRAAVLSELGRCDASAVQAGRCWTAEVLAGRLREMRRERGDRLRELARALQQRGQRVERLREAARALTTAAPLLPISVRRVGARDSAKLIIAKLLEAEVIEERPATADAPARYGWSVENTR